MARVVFRCVLHNKVKLPFVLACDACRVETHGHGHGVRTVDGRDSQVHRVSKNNVTGVQGLIGG